MGLRLCKESLADSLDDSLEIVQYVDATQTAARTGDTEQLDAILEQQKAEEAEKETPEEPPPEETPEDGEPPSDDGASPEPLSDADEQVLVTESIRNTIYRRHVTEAIDMSDVSAAAHSAWRGAAYTASLVRDLTMYLAPIGLKYSGILAQKVSAAVSHVYVLGVKALLRTMVTASTFIRKLKIAFPKHRKEIADLQAQLATLKQSGTRMTPADFKASGFNRTTSVGYLTVNGRVDVLGSLKAVSTFVQDTILPINAGISHDLKAVDYLINLTSHTTPSNLMSYMAVPPFSGKLVNRKVKHHEPNTDLVDSFVYPLVLPGEFLFVATLPKAQLTDVKEMTTAFNASSLFFVKDAQAARIDSVDYMAIDKLEQLLQQADALCVAALKHEQLYAGVVKAAEKLKFGYKHFYQRLSSSEEKVSLQESFVEFVQLKQSFVHRVYTAGAIDIDEYISTYVEHLLRYVAANLKFLSK